MKKLSIPFISSLIGTAGLMTSCSEDYPGPDPVDVIANYSNKYLSKSNLTLIYDGDEMTGKAVDFSTVKGETADVTFYNVFPGEETLKLTDIPISGDANSYSFSGNGTGDLTGSTFNYSGCVESSQLTVNLTSIKMVNSAQMANIYVLSDTIYGRRKDMIRNSDIGLYEWRESDGRTIAAPLYVDMGIELDSDGSFLHAVMTGLVKGMGGYLLAQPLDNVTLQPNGYITANYTADEMMLGGQRFNEINMEDPESMNKVTTFVMHKLFSPYPMGGFQQQDIINATERINRIYTLPPKRLAYWYMKNDHFYPKLDPSAIIIQVMKSQGKSIDQNLMALLTDAILNSDPVQLKNISSTISGQLDNSILSMLAGLDNAIFQMLFSQIEEGIPMQMEEEDGHTYLYVTKDVLTLFIPFLPSLKPLMVGIPNFGPMPFDSYTMPLYKGWSTITKLHIGIDLTVNN